MSTKQEGEHQEPTDETYHEGPRGEQHEPSPEEIIALQKLETLMTDRFDHFAIRFVNINEYQEYVNFGIATNAFAIYFPNDSASNPENFLAFLQDPTKGRNLFTHGEDIPPSEKWRELALDLTEWPAGLDDLRAYPMLIKMLRECHTDAKMEISGSINDVRSRTIRNFRDKIFEEVSNAIPLNDKRPRPLGGAYQLKNLLGALSRDKDDPLRAAREEIMRRFGERKAQEIISLWDKFINTPEEISTDELREIFRILAFHPQKDITTRSTSTSPSAGKMEPQYHLCLVFGEDAITDNYTEGFPYVDLKLTPGLEADLTSEQSPFTEWAIEEGGKVRHATVRDFYTGKVFRRTRTNLGSPSNLLGIICMDNRRELQVMVDETVIASGEWTAPVFGPNGNLVWPQREIITSAD